MTDVLHTAPLAFPILIGDIGGTNVRFAILRDAHAEPKTYAPVATSDFPDLETAIEEAVLAKTSILPRSAAIALAGPIDGNEVDLTNAPWIVRPASVMERIGLSDMVLLNDFEALALALSSLDEKDVIQVGGGVPVGYGAKAVVGPGTGLGVAGLIHAANRWIPVPGEGGHVSLGPEAAEENAVFDALRAEVGRVSGESVLCGPGLTRLHRARLRAAGGDGDINVPAEDITAAALSGDAEARETILFYCRLLGRICGDMALVFMATGGLYVGGGIVPRILPLLKDSDFRKAFEHKPPHHQMMAHIPTYVVTADRPALAGIAAFARTPSRFGVSLDGRRWS